MMEIIKPIFGSKWTDEELVAAVARATILSPEEGSSKFAALLDHGWLDIPPGLCDPAPQLHLDADHLWIGQKFSFWYGVEIYWRNIVPDHWNPSAVISSLDLSGVVSG